MILIGLCIPVGLGLCLPPVASTQPLSDPSSLRAEVRRARGSLLTDAVTSRVEKTLHPLKRGKRYPPDWTTLPLQSAHDLPAGVPLCVVPDLPLPRHSFLDVSPGLSFVGRRPRIAQRGEPRRLPEPVNKLHGFAVNLSTYR